MAVDPPFSAPAPWTGLADRVWLAVLEPESVNVGLIAGSAGALLVDSGASPEQGAALRRSAESVAGVPLTAVVVTHWHYDHAFGLAAFPDLDTVGHESVPGRLRSAEAGTEATRLGLEPQLLAVPARTLSVVGTVDLGDRRVELAHLGRGHTDGDLVVVVPDADLLFAGDLIESAGPPQFGPDSFPSEWPGTLDALVGLMTDSTRAVPGHGEPVNREFVFEARGRAAMAAAENVQSGRPPERPALPLL